MSFIFYCNLHKNEHHFYIFMYSLSKVFDLTLKDEDGIKITSKTMTV